MLARRIIACLDVRDGRVVKGTKFLDLRDAGDPLACAQRYVDGGVDEIVVLDVSATLEERIASLRTIAAVAEAVDVPVTVGGGVRGVEDFARLLDAGADKVAVNSAAVADPELLSRAARRFGNQCVVLSIDARRVAGGYECYTHAGTRAAPRDAIAWAREAQQLGAGEILLTSIDRDGTRGGFDLELIAACARAVSAPLVASGGARDAGSFADALLAGADAALGASVFHDADCTIAEVKRCCAAANLAMRT